MTTLIGYRCKARDSIADEYSLGDSAPGANVRTQEGNNPDRQLRSLKLAKWETKWEG